MDKVYLRFPSGRTFLLLDDIVSIKDEKRLFFVFWNEESLKTNFHIETKAGKPSCYSFYASPTKIGVKNITKKEGNFFVILCNTKSAKECFFSGLKSCGNKTADTREYFILSEEPAHGGIATDINIDIGSTFQVYTLDRLYPVSFTPFSFHNFSFIQSDQKKELMSFGDEQDFTIAYLEGNKITVSPNLGALEGFYEIDEMDRLVNHIIGHMHLKNISVLKEYSNYSITANYVRKFAHSRSVNHIHSHLSSVMFDNGLIKEKGIGIVYDSISYNESDQIQGSEILYGRIGDFETAASWKPVPLPGGDIANIEPWRIALAIIKESMKGDVSTLDIPLIKNLKNNPNSKYLFDAINQGNMHYSLSTSMHHIIAALGELLDFAESTYDFDFFENMMDKFFIEQYTGEYYKINIFEDNGIFYADTYELFTRVIGDLFTSITKENLVYKAIFGISKATVDLVEIISKKYHEKKVFLTGEFFKHQHFLTVFYNDLVKRGLEVYIHKDIPVDDSSISVGQILYHYYLKKQPD